MSRPSPAAAAGEPIERHVWLIAIVVLSGAVMSILDMTIVNVALEDLGRDLHAPLSQIQWIVTGYTLAVAAVIPLTGWLSRRLGTKTVYIGSLVLFTLGSVLCALAWSAGSLIAFRVVQGVGGGMLMPIGQIMLATAAGPQRMGRVMSVVSVPMVLAPVLGPVAGGLLLENLGWQWIFLINVPVGVVAFVLAMRLLPSAPRGDAGPLDRLGLGLLAVGLPALTYGVSRFGETGVLGDWQVLVPIVGGLVLLVAFVLHALRLTEPLLDVRLFRMPAFSSAAITTLCLGAALFGAMILMPLYFQLLRGEDAVATGLLLAPQGIGAAIAMPISGILSDRVGGGRIAVAGILISIVSTVPFALVGADTPYLGIELAMVLRGFGIGMSMMPAMVAAYATLKPSDIPHATPQLTVLQRVGGSFGTAILAIVLQNGLEGARSKADAAAAFDTTYWWVIGVTAVALIPALVLARIEHRARAAGRATAELPDDALTEVAG